MTGPPGPGDGMEKSYEEILRLLERLHMDAEDLFTAAPPTT